MDIKNTADNHYGVDTFEQGFYTALNFLIPARFERLQPDIDARKQQLIAENAALATDTLAQMHVAVTCLVLATFEILQEEYDRADSIKLTKDAFVGSLGDKVTTGTKQLFDESADPFREIVGVSKQRETHYFGESFSFERQQDDDSAYLLDITKCFYHKLLSANGATDLTPIFCAFDGNWIEAIDSQKHGFRFERPATIGWGHDRCRFYFFRG